MKKSLLILFTTATIALMAAESDFSRNILFPKPDAYNWRKALGIDTNVFINTNTFFFTLTNSLVGGTNIVLVYSNNVIFINAPATSTNGGTVTLIGVTSSNLLVSNSPVTGTGGYIGVNLPWNTNLFVDTNQFRSATNVMLDTNTFRVWTNTLVSVNTNLLVDTNMFRSATNVMLDTNTFRVWTNTLVIVNTNQLIDTNYYLNPTNIGIRRPLFYRTASIGVISGTTNILLSGSINTNQATMVNSLNATGTAASGTTSNGPSINYATAASANAAMSVNDSTATWFYSKSVYLETLCLFDNTNSMRAFVGFLSAGNAANVPIQTGSEGGLSSANTIGFKYSSTAGHTTWWVYAVSATTTTSNNTSVAMSANTLYHLAMYYDAASTVSYFWINGTLVVSNIGTPPVSTASAFFSIVHSTQESVTKTRNFYGLYAESPR